MFDTAPFHGFLRSCRKCGCTDSRACPSGCYWVEADLCSACHRRRPAWREIGVTLHLFPFDWRLAVERDLEFAALHVGPLSLGVQWAWKGAQ
jgi:hypothetical protein